jgi:hypothetical protein
MLPGLETLLTIRTGISEEILFVCEKEVTETYSRCYSRMDSKGVTLDPMGLCHPYGCKTHMLMVAEIVIGDRFCTSPAYVLRAKYWVVDWARPTSLTTVPWKFLNLALESEVWRHSSGPISRFD